MSTSSRSGYHHGDLRASALTSAMAMLEAGEPFSLRAVARDVGVSAPALYRHFADRDALESALAAEGLRDLLTDLATDRQPMATAADLADLAVAYVAFALRRPALFRVMFGKPCDTENDERVAAADRIHGLLEAAVAQAFPAAEAGALADAGWAFAHGMASLYLDGKLRADSDEAIAAHVRSAFSAMLSIRPPAPEHASEDSPRTGC
ncbi:MAG: TetR/AcrR family transcriptional regulator [Gordonia sp. (in: high G+C Gram-positive bacteria)]|uniref:TetR/AcrR family transcriptional regulator n=1 Tax=Gordonia sp. (in: high G+C Gram-positive bacteria) TaxID=84139 RepID=UPI0039E2AE22